MVTGWYGSRTDSKGTCKYIWSVTLSLKISSLCLWVTGIVPPLLQQTMAFSGWFLTHTEQVSKAKPLYYFTKLQKCL